MYILLKFHPHDLDSIQSVTYVGYILVWGLWIENEDTTFIYVLMEYVHYVIHRNIYFIYV